MEYIANMAASYELRRMRSQSHSAKGGTIFTADAMDINPFVRTLSGGVTCPVVLRQS